MPTEEHGNSVSRKEQLGGSLLCIYCSPAVQLKVGKRTQE